MDEKAFEAKLRSTYEQVDQWVSAMARPLVPELGSDLQEDDKDWPTLPVSQLVHVGLAVAADHLDAIRCHLDAHHLFTFADLTVCRSALVGASQAVWILAPEERSQRLERARMLAADELRYHRQFVEELRAAQPRNASADVVADHLQMRIAGLREQRSSEGEPLVRHENTRMIREAAAAVFPPDLAAQTLSEWRSGSGAAHGLIWSVLGTPDTKQVGAADAAGLAEFHALGSLGRLANAYMAAFHMAGKGWSLLAKRNTPDSGR
jgi:hypothetical protein